ncbi:MAG TPA: hypothetical protein ENN51_04300 [candidate division WOR-3 bacterium]|uniref:Right-handed parallel beta-helix repeat-containing protein n=1 Tax=candidate division WOR-3 bacterium TaxID=2052148 RepID=A0A7V0T5C6_UNCW3|nr:hypothetical protein [candidate division WOR-3 bacterium]
MLTRLRGPAFALILLALSCPRVLKVGIIEPRAGTLVRGTTVVRARASGPSPVISVELLTGERSLGVATNAAGNVYEISFSSATLLPDTSAELVCVALDADGTTARSAPVRVRVFPGTRHEGELARPETWTESGNPHIVEGNLRVRALLRLEAGTEVHFVPGASITVGLGVPGALQASGRPGRPVRFTSLAAPPAPGDWRGLRFHAAAGPESSRLRHCIVEYGTDLVYSDAAGISIETCSLRHASGFGAIADSTGFALFADNHVTACELPVRVGPAWTDRLAADNVFIGNRHDAAGIIGRELRASATWPRREWSWCLLGPLTVSGPSAPTLEISPGCSVLFSDSAAIRVGIGLPGALRAVGEGQPVVLAPLDSAAGWPGIELWPAADPLRTALSNCVVTGAGRAASAALLVLAPATVTDVTITDSRATGVRVSGAGFNLFARNTITGGAGRPLSIEAEWLGSIGPANRFDGNARDTVEVRPGRVVRSAWWGNLGVPHRVTGPVSVGGANAPTLTIDAGAHFVFDPEAGLTVGLDSTGVLLALGAGDSVTFTGGDTVRGAWQGITLGRYAGSSRLERCRLLYGGRDHPGILHVRESNPVITGCEIGWSSNHCVVLTSSPLDPDQLEEDNWIHEPAPGYDEIFEEGR